ncbi:beta-xylosidase [Hymenobacter sp. HMF4947]|uniref:Beta-xylosidase n=1 Tax=Hymenobacter ginkgonis TaxID=2682976 RepID=A0A7K1TGU4_9BACT|nr:glycosyl hydrolase [Hymenobacter ginkgonis]MVN77630.1 beta-xylosidase [Hymenobacter ginkgonis]
MIEAVKFWNEPNNKAHWAFEIDPHWRTFAEMVRLGAQAVKAENAGIRRVLGGISPIDPLFVKQLQRHGALQDLNAVAVHGFPLDWSLWPLHEWPTKIAEVAAVTTLPIWVTEVGASSFGAEEVQVFGLRRTAELLLGKPRVERVFWCSLFDLPQTRDGAARHREAEGVSYHRHFHMGLLREDGTPKLALKHFADYTPELGICQWFHYEDPRFESALAWLRRLGVRKLRTGLSWADWLRPDAERWFDHVMRRLEEFEVTATFCFTPEAKGIQPRRTSPPRHPEEFADFCATMTRRYT